MRKCDLQSIERDQQRTQVLDLAEKDFKITVINMLKSLQEKMDITYKEMGNGE